uniref:Uncharacterized protein n=1 Tax=Tanacetum cinerariifolium TaxID=118510 RepID=A0A699HF13_TANCI|nr:hypothetical protein [Tanacetum cinerariifolium]
MPIKSNEPPDPLFDELCTLTRVRSAEDLCAASFNDTKIKVMKVKHSKPHRGVKISTPGSAGAGSVLRRLRSAKTSKKARDRNEDSLGDNRGGKRVGSTPMDDENNKVLSNVRSSMLNSNLKFYLGRASVCALNNVSDVNELSNDGFFIKSPLDNSGLNDLGCLVAKSCSLQTSFDHTGNVNDKDMAGSGTINEHTSMEDVVNTGGVCSCSQDGIASYKVGRGFVFGKKENSNGILNPSVGPFFNVNFSNIASGNPFIKKHVASNGGTWNIDRSKSFGYSMRSNQFSAYVDRFTEKLKQGSKEIALKMEYVPSSVCKLENGNRSISFLAEEVYKGGQACSLQLYGYFVGTSMDYRVVRGNLMRMRVHDIEDITKTSSGEPGIWLEKTEPSSIPIWVCVYNIPMELCNGSGIGKIMSGVGKPLLMDKMTRERCLKKAGKIDFARVLVEVFFWVKGYPVRPRTEEEVAAKTLKDVLKVGKTYLNDKGKSVSDDDGFTVVGKKNKPVVSQYVEQAKVGGQNRWGERGLNNVKQGYGNSGGGNSNFYGQRRVGGYVQRYQYQQKSHSNAGNVKSGGKFNTAIKGSGSANVVDRPLNEDIPVNNSFNVLSNNDENVEDLGDIKVNEEFDSKVWPDDERDVDSNEEGIVVDMKPVVDVNVADSMEINAAANKDEDTYSFCGLLETHVKKKNLFRICNRVLGRWDWVSNSSSYDSGTRNIVGWGINHVNIMVLNQSAQVMHCFIEPVNGNPGFFCSFVYACVHTIERRSLWKSLSIHKNVVKDRPCTILGDFNACLDPSERSTGGSKFTTAMHDFRNCVALN